MKRIIPVIVILTALCSCTTIKVDAPKGTVKISADKDIDTNMNPNVSPTGNTVPVSAVP